MKLKEITEKRKKEKNWKQYIFQKRKI